jgi:hypothetical protein
MSRAASPGPASPGPASPGPASPGPASPGPASAGPSRSVAARPTDTWRRWRAPLGIMLVILLGGALIALLQPSAHEAGYLDPTDPGPFGTRALAHLLAPRGEPVIRAGTVQSAEAAAQGRSAPGRSAPGSGVTLVVTNPGLLSGSQLDRLAGVHASLLLVEPVPAELTALAPGTSVAGDAPVRNADPGCSLPAAMLAGSADMGGVLLRSTAPGAWRCYRMNGQPSLVRYRIGGRTITLLGAGTPLTNQYLGGYGNAALALDLLSGNSRIVWLVPSLAPGGGPPPGGPKSLLSLIPRAAYLVTIQLAIAVVLAALWRMRRLGPLVTEPLPVIVRASETVEGHGRLYRSRRSRDRAAAVLRDAALNRITIRLALPRGAGADPVCAAVAARTGRQAASIKATLFGPVPRDDAALVTLARDIDTLEADTIGEVHTH